jgi:hypothetical protein
MPLPSIVFEVGPIAAISTREFTPNESSTRASTQFVQARQVNTQRRRWRLSWGTAPLVTAEAVLDLWRRTFGGASRMLFVPPDSTGSFAVRFGGEPTIAWSQTGSGTAQMTVELVEV